jgi:hypothetical protein
MSDTPETDRQWAEWLNKLKMPIESFVDFARGLERERNKARDMVHRLRKQRAIARNFGEQMERERDEARKALLR